MARGFKIIKVEDDFVVVELNVNGDKKEVVYDTSPGEENILMHIEKEMDKMEVTPTLEVLVKKNIDKDVEIIKTQEEIVDTRRTTYVDKFEAKIK